jgi:DNA-binding MarR family transcriptional regulator
MYSQSQRKAASFRAVAHLVAHVTSDRGRSDLASLSRTMRQTPERVRTIVDRAEGAGLLEARRNVVVLTSAGRRLRDKVKTYESDAQAAGQETFRPYTDYRPRGWLPPRKRAF